MIKGYLKIAVLKELSLKDNTGYELMNTLKNVMGTKPSAGSIYPLLNDLSEKKLISVKEVGRKKIYSITQNGKNITEKLCIEKEEILNKHLNMLNLFSTLGDEEDIIALKKTMGKINSCSHILFENIKNWHELREVSLQIITSDNYQSQKKEFQNIINNTIKDLKKLTKHSKNK